ncbi:MAG TPA: bi-domain-containing oxidoreductase [Kiritimatiellia bacterium]|nr:bi-domain-containing oxidoreductase [Kiritimatiellia bacterium]
MKQVLQDRKSGRVNVVEVPEPQRGEGQLLVRVHASVISAGTESAMVAATGRSLLQRIADKPDLILKGIETVKSRGISGLRNQIEGKYAGYEALGYSCAGVVMETTTDASGIIAGTRVACGGIGYANHAEVISVPHRLCAIVPENVDDETAAYTTIGAIAMQGVRQACVSLGEHVVVIGLGLVGLLTVQLLRAAGCTVTGVDTSPSARNRGLGCGCRNAVDPASAHETVLQATRGIGADAILICASTTSNDPVALAGELSRSRGRVVMVGATGMEIPREQYFRKELSFTLSRSYGPGRYDTTYEEEGVDYPVDFVRFTEQRNMQAFLDLAATGAISIKDITTHRFALDYASGAYELLSDRNTDRVGILLEYPKPTSPAKLSRSVQPTPIDKIGVSFIGAGNYSENVLLPGLRAIDGISLRCVATRQSAHAESVVSRFSFAYSATDAEKAIADNGTQAVFIATHHDTHAKYAISALAANKQVWVEKPLALTLEELEQVSQAMEQSSGRLVVGFNRRFSPLIQKLKSKLPAGSPVMINYRVNAGRLPPDHWTQNRDTGGGRLIGEGCHFIDLICHLAGSEPIMVYATGIKSERIDLPAESNFVVSITFRNGSVGQVVYASEGASSLSKERMEVFSGGLAAILEDYRTLNIYRGNGEESFKLKHQDKGQQAMLRAFIDSLRGKGEFPMTKQEVLTSSRVTLLAQQSLGDHKVLHVN